MNKKLSASDLRSFVGLGKGSLENHLSKLKSSEFVNVRFVRSWGGIHQVVEITDKGLEECKTLLKKIHDIDVQ
jgi:DNA-binding PadR family transcriptional regulator